MKKITCLLVAALLILVVGICAHAEAIDLDSPFIDELPTNFFTWDVLGTFGGAILGVAILTQLTKEIKYIKAIPTQLWSYIIAVLLLVLSRVFTGEFSASSVGLAFINGALVSLASNGTYSLFTRVKGAIKTKTAAANADAENTKKEYEATVLSDVDIGTWTLEQLKAFCILNHVPCELCETREDFILAIENFLPANEIEATV